MNLVSTKLGEADPGMGGPSSQYPLNARAAIVSEDQQKALSGNGRHGAIRVGMGDVMAPVLTRAHGAVLPVVVTGAVLAIVWVSGPIGPRERAQEGSRGRTETSLSSRTQADKTPSPRPPAQTCGSRSLKGPKAKPHGAVAVGPKQNLYDVVNDHPPGTTFWLEPGVFLLNKDEFGQVIPKRGDSFVGAPGAVLDGQHINRYAFTGFARNVSISYLTIQHFGTKRSNNGEGVVNHDSARGWRVLHNTIQRNGGAGVFLGNHGRVRGNCLANNGEYGFQALVSRHSVLAHNEIKGNNTADWETLRPGCGCTGGGKFWDAREVSVINNYVHDNRGPGLWADTNNAGLLFKGNYIADNDDEGILYEISYNAHIVDNVFARNGWVKGPTNPGFPTGAIYLSESGSDPRVKARFGKRFLIARNRFVNNWAGVVGWENADRFAGSPNNASTGYSTLVNPKVVNLTTCVPGTIDNKPYYDDCRWKTQRLRIVHNRFLSRPNEIPGCKKDTGCGYQGLFSNWGTSPDWSPYQGRVVERAITRKQHNRWAHNHYHGRWHFMVKDQAGVVSWHTWRSRWGQDHGSTRN